LYRKPPDFGERQYKSRIEKGDLVLEYVACTGVAVESFGRSVGMTLT
jgi:hypothetical protein